MENLFCTPCVKLEKLNNLFIELTARNCNQKCKHCYIDFPISHKVKDFISLDKVKFALDDTINEDLQCIYFTGAEPMTHPDFNALLRLCLKRSSVCICTNASFINEKKARFLKKVEEEGDNEIIFRLSIDHYNELKNDEIRGRGAFRQTFVAVKSLVKYGFNPIFGIVNYFHEDNSVLISEFKRICESFGFETNDYNFQINEYYDRYHPLSDFSTWKDGDFDCKTGRILTENGIYSCPFLANDHRGWMGESFKNYSKKVSPEAGFCLTCSKNKNKMFGLNF